MDELNIITKCNNKIHYPYIKIYRVTVISNLTHNNEQTSNVITVRIRSTNKKDLRFALKTKVDWLVCILGGKEFHNLTAVKEKPLSLSVFKRVTGNARVRWSAAALVFCVNCL